MSHTRYLAGGTDLVVNIRRGIEQPKNLIDLTSIEEVQEIEETKSGLAIGSGVTLNRVRDLCCCTRVISCRCRRCQGNSRPDTSTVRDRRWKYLFRYSMSFLQSK